MRSITLFIVSGFIAMLSLGVLAGTVTSDDGKPVVDDIGQKVVSE
tara:strand:- start:239 stop:373 length:135 start_codon:yes stop_codon:yes gene_type:complete